MRIEVSVEVTGSARAEIAQTCSVIVNFDPRRLLPGRGASPAVADASDLVGRWAQAGDRREIQMSDGSRLIQELLYLDHPVAYGYQLFDFAGPLSWIIREVHGHWRFTALPDGRTAVRWRYVFQGRRGMPYPVGWVLVRVLWVGYMRAALARVLAAVDASATAPPAVGDTGS